MAKKWAEVAASPEYKALSGADRERARNEYFDAVVAPQIAPEDVDSARSEFDSSTKPTFFAATKDAFVQAKDNIIGAVADPFGKGIAPEQPADWKQKADPLSGQPLNDDIKTPAQKGQDAADAVPVPKLTKDYGFGDAGIDLRQAQDEAYTGAAQGRRARQLRQQTGTQITDATAKQMIAEEEISGQPKVGSTVSKSDFDFDTHNQYKDAGTIERGAARGVNAIKQQAAGLHEFLGDTLGADGYANAMADTGKKLDNEAGAIGDRSQYLTRNWEGAVSSIVSQTPGLTIAALSGGSVPLLMMGAQVFGDEYQTGKAAGLSYGERTTRAAVNGVAEIIGERIGMPSFAKVFRDITQGAPTDQMVKDLAAHVMREIPGEQLTTAIQFSNDKFTPYGLNQEAGLTEYLQQSADTLVQTVMQSGAMGSVGIAKSLPQARRDQSATVAADVAKENAMGAWDKAFNPPSRAQTIKAEVEARKAKLRGELGIPEPADDINQDDLLDELGGDDGQLAGATNAEVADPRGAVQAGDLGAGAGNAAPAIDGGNVLGSASGTPVGRVGEDQLSGTAGGEASAVDAAANEAATSPNNDLPEPTLAQKEAGNYKVGRVKLHGLDISIENPAGSTRSGTDEDGKAWETELAHHYGYVKRTTGADGDQVDVFIGSKPESPRVFVVDQVNPKTGAFDEHKALLGFDNQDEALAAYRANYQPGWKGAAAIHEMPVSQFKDWLNNGDTTKPIARHIGNAPTTEQVAPQASEAPGAQGLSIGTTPNNSEPVTVKNGVVHVGNYPAMHFETGEDVTVPAGADSAAIAQALRDAGVLSSRQRIYGLPKAAKPAPQPAAQPASPVAEIRKARAKRAAKSIKTSDELAAQSRKTFIKAIKDMGGIKSADARDVSGEPAHIANRMAPGLFRTEGNAIDLIARRLHELGYLPEADYTGDVDGGSQAARDLIGRALSGDAVMTAAEQERYNELAAKEQELAEGMPARNEALADAVEAEATQDDGLDLDAQPMSEADAMRALGFTEEEINEQQPNTQSGDTQAAERTAEGRANESAAAGAGQARPAGAADEGTVNRRDGTTRPTSEEHAALKAEVEALRNEKRTSTLAGIPNLIAFEEDAALGWEFVGAADMDGMSFYNDLLGHHPTDVLIRTVGDVLSRYAGDSVRFYHRSGDEFMARASDRAALENALSSVQAELEGVITMIETVLDDGSRAKVRITGLGLSYGTNHTYAEADKNASQAKQDRTAAGKRAPKGSNPGGIEVLEEANGGARSLGERGESRESAQERLTGFSLDGQTAAQAEAADKAAKQAAADKADADAKAEAKQKADAERDDFTLTGSARASDANPGQADIFSQGKLESFGDQVKGRRDSYRKAYGDKMGLAVTEDVAAVPLSKSWPEPDYTKLLEDGADPWGVAFIHAARDEIPSKPGSTFKLSRWTEQVRQLRDMANNILSGEISPAAMKTLLAQDKFRVLREAVGSRADLYEAVGHGKSLKGITVSSGQYGIFEGKEYNPPKVFWSVQQKAKATAFSNWPRMLSFADTREAAIAAFKQKIDGLELDKPADKTVRFDLYSYRGKPGVWIGKKVGKGYIDLKHFDDTKAARAYLAGNQAELEALLAKKKEIPNERRDHNLPRVGADHRNGQDVTPEMFNETFGFKGVRFGDTMPNAERIANLNQTYDALMDMAGVIGIPPKALSLNGELNIAFGALGTGGKKAAAAHYEPDTVVINLTRKNGPGSLAHEWFHAVDNYFSRMRGMKSAFTTEALDVSLAARGSDFMANTAIRKEMIDAFGLLVKAINTGNFIARSRALDARRSKPYWSTRLEMAARTFESYVIAKLQDQGASNDYLANVVSKEYWDAKEALGMEDGGTYPYPTADEMPAVRAAFDNFFNVVETKETDTGTVMFSRTTEQPAFYSQLTRAVESAPDKMFATPAQFKLWLIANSAKLGIKKDEIQWSGITDFLDMQGKGKVSKADVVRFLSENGVKVQDVVLGGGDLPDGWRIVRRPDGEYEVRDEDDVGVASGETERAAINEAQRSTYANRPPTKFASYTPHGGIPGTYREILVTLPSREKFAQTDQYKIYGWGNDASINEEFKTNSEAEKRLAELTNRGHENIAISSGRGLHQVGVDDFTSSHFDQPNILVHLRTDEVTGADGKRYLRVVEVQSDWGQKGKKEGFSSPENLRIQQRLTAVRKRLDEIRNLPAEQVGMEERELWAEQQQLERDVKGSVPAAPFVQDTRAWVSLGIKRAIQHAVSSGVDGIVFATGQQNADLYDLSKQVDSISWYKNPDDGTYSLDVYKSDKIVTAPSKLDANGIAGIVGKDIADRITSTDADSGELSGLDIKVGGEGMRAFYDTIVPSVANDVLKKLGGGKVGVVEVDGGLTLEQIEALPTARERAEARTKARAMGAGTGATQPGFLIPESLKAKVSEGLPMFQRGGKDNPDAGDMPSLEDIGKIGPWNTTPGYSPIPAGDLARVKAQLVELRLAGIPKAALDRFKTITGLVSQKNAAASFNPQSDRLSIGRDLLNQPADEIRGVLSHEAGHAIDVVRFDDVPKTTVSNHEGMAAAIAEAREFYAKHPDDGVLWYPFGNEFVDIPQEVVRQELFAQFVRLYATRLEEFKAFLPGAYKFTERAINETERVRSEAKRAEPWTAIYTVEQVREGSPDSDNPARYVFRRRPDADDGESYRFSLRSSGARRVASGTRGGTAARDGAIDREGESSGVAEGAKHEVASESPYTDPDASPEEIASVRALNRELSKYFGSDKYGAVLFKGRRAAVPRAITEAFRAAFGRRVVFIQPKPGTPNLFNGFQVSGSGDLYVNGESNVGFVQIAGHELWHHIQRTRPDLIDWYRQQSRQYYKDLPEYRDRLNTLLEPGEKAYTDSAAESELEADFLGDSLADPVFLQQLADSSPDKFKQFMTKVRLWLAGVAQKLRGLGSDQHITDVRALQKHLGEVLKAYADGKPITSIQSRPEFSRGSVGLGSKVWRMLAGDDAIYQNPLPDSFDMEGAAQEINRKMFAREDALDIEEEKHLAKKWHVTMPDGTHAYVMENRKGEVWIDASRLEEGASGGTRLYLLVGSYAEGNGKVFVGDPAGLSDVALIRRTENMLSLALRFGNTDFLRPHEYQMNPEAKLNTVLADVVRPLDWVDGDSAGNIDELLRTSYANTLNLFPEIKDVTYNFDKQRFERDGAEFTDFDGIRRRGVGAIRQRGLAKILSTRKSGGSSGKAEDFTPIGSATLKRAAVLNTVARAARGGRGGELLAEIGRVLPGGLKGTPLAGILYSRSQPPNSPTNPQQTPPPGGVSASVPAETRARRAQRIWQDQLNRFTVIQEWLRDNGVTLGNKHDVYRAEERMHGKIAAQIEDFRETRLRPLIVRIHKAGFNMQQVGEYLVANHAAERNAQIAKINPGAVDHAGKPNGSGMTDAEAQDVLNRYAALPAFAKFETMAEEFRAITGDTQRILLDAGIISQEMADAWNGAYQHYVPLRGGPDDAGMGNASGKGISVNARGEHRRALGHKARDEWAVENIIHAHERAIYLAEKNRVGQHLVSLAVAVPDSRLWTIDKPVKRQVLKPGQATFVVEHQGIAVGSFDTRKEADLFVTAMVTSANKTPSNFTVTRTVGDPQVAYMASGSLADNEVQIYVRGHMVRIQLNDPLLARAYKKMGQTHLVGILEVGREVNAFLSKMYTGLNLEFIETNIQRDLISGVVNITGEEGIGMAGKAIKNWLPSLRDMLRYSMTGKASVWVRMYREDGGNTGAAYLSDLERVGKSVQAAYDEAVGVRQLFRESKPGKATKVVFKKSLHFVAGWIEHMNAAAENGMRVALYRSMVEAGKGRAAAASAAKNSTVNFNRKGEIGAQLSALYLFANPAIQGSASMAHALFKGKHKGQAWALMGTMAGLAYLLALAYGDDDEWDEVPQHEKDRNMLIRVGDHVAKIAVPYGHGIAFALGNAIYDLQRGKDTTEVAYHMASAILENIAPLNPLGDKPDLKFAVVELAPFEPFRIFARIGNNTSGFQRQIMPDSKFDESQPDFLKAYRNTHGTVYDQLTRGMSKATGGTATQAGAIDVSPETLKFLFESATGGTGRFFMDTFQATILAAQGSLPELQETPIVRKLVRDANRVSDSRARFWESVNKAQTVLDNFRRAKNGVDVEAAPMFRDTQIDGLSRLVNDYKEVSGAARDYISAVKEMEGKTAAEKRLMIFEAERVEQKLYRQGVQEIDRRIGEGK